MLPKPHGSLGNTRAVCCPGSWLCTVACCAVGNVWWGGTHKSDTLTASRALSSPHIDTAPGETSSEPISIDSICTRRVFGGIAATAAAKAAEVAPAGFHWTPAISGVACYALSLALLNGWEEFVLPKLQARERERERESPTATPSLICSLFLRLNARAWVRTLGPARSSPLILQPTATNEAVREMRREMPIVAVSERGRVCS